MALPFAAEQGGVAVEAGGYTFFIPACQVGAVHPSPGVVALPHGPSWLAGMALVDGQVMGVIDWGRFLGVARRCPGPLIQPHSHLGVGWVLQVGTAQSIPAVQWLETEAEWPSPSTAEGWVSEWASRPRPAFVVGRAVWTDERHAEQAADVIDLSVLLTHPRLLEFAA